MDIGSGFGGDDRQRYLRIALIVGVALVVLLLILIVVAIVRGRAGGGDPTATPQVTPGRTPSVVVVAPSGTPRATVAVSIAPSAAPSAPAASASAAPSAAPSASAAGRAFVIANTDGEGLRMRSEPATTASEVVVLPEGARVTEIGPGRNADGRDWLNVQDADGNKGWIAAEFTAPAP